MLTAMILAQALTGALTPTAPESAYSAPVREPVAVVWELRCSDELDNGALWVVTQ